MTNKGKNLFVLWALSTLGVQVHYSKQIVKGYMMKKKTERMAKDSCE